LCGKDPKHEQCAVNDLQKAEAEMRSKFHSRACTKDPLHLRFYSPFVPLGDLPYNLIREVGPLGVPIPIRVPEELLQSVVGAELLEDLEGARRPDMDRNVLHFKDVPTHRPWLQEIFDWMNKIENFRSTVSDLQQQGSPNMIIYNERDELDERQWHVDVDPWGEGVEALPSEVRACLRGYTIWVSLGDGSRGKGIPFYWKESSHFNQFKFCQADEKGMKGGRPPHLHFSNGKEHKRMCKKGEGFLINCVSGIHSNLISKYKRLILSVSFIDKTVESRKRERGTT